MGRAVLIAITLIVLMLQSSIVIGSSGQVLKVVDGDTFLMDVAGVRGPETLEVNLRCSDAPIVSGPFGKESKQYLETLLKGAEIHLKIQAYCGAETCVEVLAYIPDPISPQITYINTQMIAAGMARNDSCRGVFNEAEAQAKSGKKGIWSTTKKIVFAETAKVEKPESTKATSKPTTLSLNPKAAAALIEVDRVERTVTLKSTSMSLSKAIKAVDTVSTLPVSLYLIEEQYIAISLEKVSWYKALQHIASTANLKQVNMNGKIDLYDQLFYYKHIAPHLKLSDNDGVYIKAGSGSKSPVVDDGVTRYVFINDFENSAAEARQADDQSGFVQVHQGSSPAPVSNYGRFEVSADKAKPAAVAAAESEVTAPPTVEPPPLKPYSGKKVVAEQEKPIEAVAAPAVKAVEAVSEPVAEKKVALQEPVANPVVSAIGKEAKTAQPVESGTAGTSPADKATDSEPVLNIELTSTELIVLLIVVVVVVFGSIFLSRSAATRAAKAEKGIDPDALGNKDDTVVAGPETLVDKAYEKEVFEDIDHADSSVETEIAVDDIFQDSSVLPVEPATEETAELNVRRTKDGVDKQVEVEVVADEEAPAPEEKPEVAEQAEVSGQVEEEEAEDDTAVVAVEDDSAVEEQPETVDEKEDSVQPEDEAKTKVKEKSKKKPGKSAPKKAKGLVVDEGNYAVTLDDYDRLMNPPKREPRTDCLFEVTCSLDDQTTTGIGLDISSGGIFIDSKEHFAAGKVLELEFKLEDDDPEPIRCRGAVTWVNERPDPIKPNYPNGFGIHFLDVDAATVQAIDAFLDPDTVGDSDEAEEGS